MGVKPVDKAFAVATSPVRKAGILPENMSTPRKTVDVLRGKTMPSKGSLLTKPLALTSRTTGTILGTR